MGKVINNVTGALFGSRQSASGNTSSSGDPIRQDAFNIARPLYQDTVTQGQSLLNDVFANPAFGGPRVAGLNPFQVNSANFTGNFANQTGQNAFNLINAGNANLNPGMNFGTNAQNTFNRFAGVDPTQNIINNAAQFANNPFVDGMIDAAGRDVTRNLFENQLTGIDRAAAGSGNINSTRAGVESAIAQRGAADRLADMSSSIRSQFFGKGLDMAQNQFNQNLRNELLANQPLLEALNAGTRTLGAGNDFARMNFGLGQGAGSVFQGQEQAELDANRAMFDEALTNRIRALGASTGVLGGGQGFSGGPTSGTTSESQTKTPSLASIIGSFLRF